MRRNPKADTRICCVFILASPPNCSYRGQSLLINHHNQTDSANWPTTNSPRLQYKSTERLIFGNMVYGFLSAIHGTVGVNYATLLIVLNISLKHHTAAQHGKLIEQQSREDGVSDLFSAAGQQKFADGIDPMSDKQTESALISALPRGHNLLVHDTLLQEYCVAVMALPHDASPEKQPR